MDCTAIILTIGIIFAASFFSTVSGFGFALVAMPVLTLVMSVKAAVIFVLLLNLVLGRLLCTGCVKAMIKQQLS